MKINQIKNTTRLAFLIILFIFSIGTAEAHSGRTDANGGHNCRVGACAGTYHYHNGGGAPAPQQPYVAPTSQARYIAPTAIPTRIPTQTPTPTAVLTDTPTPILEPTNTPTPTVVQSVKSTNTKKPTGFWGFILSLFGN